MLINGWLYQRVDHDVWSLMAFMLGIHSCFLSKPLNGYTRVKRRWTSRIPALAELEQIARQSRAQGGRCARHFGAERLRVINKGDILVAQSTSPIWTPLLGIAAAAVTEVGGPFAHAAVAAREFGIPLVDGATDATHVIADGGRIVVDGTAEIVEI